jgi:large subunit ribosomal protein L32e
MKMSIQELLNIRKGMKRTKPKFLRQDINKKKRLGRKWRKPRGLDSKIRQMLKGRQRGVDSGFIGPKKTRGLHESGLKIVMVGNTNDLENIDKKTQGIIIYSAVGNKKRAAILKKSIEKGIKVLNFKNSEKEISKIEDSIASRKKLKAQKSAASKKLPDKKSEKKTDAPITKKEEKAEKDKILTQKEN